MQQSRRLKGPILLVRTKTSSDSAPVPPHVTRQPLPELESALSRGAIAPRGRHLRNAHSKEVCFDSQLNAQLKAAGGFDGHLLQQALRIEAEVAGGIVHWYARKPVQRETGGAGHRPLEQWSTELVAAAHIARSRHHVRAVSCKRIHRVDVAGVV